jgi:fructokinase
MIAAFGEILFDVYLDEEHLGGAPFNFIYHIHKLTGEGSIISRIGDDERGRKIYKFLAEKGIDQSFLHIDEEHPTGTATVRLDSSGTPTFTIEENVAYDFIETPSGFDNGIDLLYFGTLAQRSTISRNTLEQLINNSHKCFLDINLRQQYYTREILERSFAAADIVKLNLEEFQTIHPLFSSESFELEENTRSFLKKFSLSHLAVTLGENGSCIFTENESHFHQTKTKNVIDTVGAGDAFSAMMCLGILKGLPLNEIHKAASDFSAALCGIKGALPVDDGFYEGYKKV